MNAAPRYTAVAVAFHWLLALLLVGVFGFGLYMVELPFSPARLKQYNWHKWAGITILVLSAVRLLWRLSHRPPALPPGMPAWQRTVSHGLHGLMYLLFFAVPLAGWAYSNATGFPVVVWGLVPLPDLVARDESLAAALKALHRALAYGLAACVALHLAAALKHHFIDRDGLIGRMAWGKAA